MLGSPYVVSEDLADASETKIHTATCLTYIGRKEDAKTMRWHGPFESISAAQGAAKRIAAGSLHDCASLSGIHVRSFSLSPAIP